MKISIITPSFNSETTIADTIESVNKQTHSDIEHIIIDGGSSDRTLEILKNKHQRHPIIISENDKGLYDAINKGLNIATGDIIGILNSDDTLENANTLSDIATQFDQGAHVVYGDVLIYKRHTKKKHRHYSSRNFHFWKFKFGLMPAHPSIYLAQEVARFIGHYDTKYSIAADFEYCLRLFSQNQFVFKYLPQYIVKMSAGGISDGSIKSKHLISNELLNACASNGVHTNRFLITLRYIIKLKGFAI